jgi:hypothetical protein
MKSATEFKQLSGILFKVHNPQVAMAYGDQPFLRSALLIRTADNFTTIALKIFIFYLVCGRINTAATTPMYWPTKVQKGLRAQLAIAFRPEKRRRIKFGRYDPNTQCHIPHYNGTQNPKIPSYTVGIYSCRVTLTDQSTILINGDSETEAQRVVDALLKYVEPKFIPKEIHYVHTKRKGIKLEAQRVRPFRADYYPPASQTPQWSVQL